MSNLRQQVIESQKARSDFLKWKLILVAALGSTGLGLSGKNGFENAYLILSLIPLVCIYVDALCVHLYLRIKIIGVFFRYQNGDENDEKYEGLLEKLSEKKWHANFEIISLITSTFFLALIIIIYAKYYLHIGDNEKWIIYGTCGISIIGEICIFIYQKKEKKRINSNAKGYFSPPSPPKKIRCRQMKNKYERLLVTGHLGFIASEFCNVYNEKYEICGVDFAGWGSMAQNLAKNVKDIRADIADGERVKEIINEFKPDAIINFAAESHVDRSNEDDSCFWRSNVLGARNLALEACQMGIRMVHVSTDEVYGDAISSSEPWTENSPLAPKNPYAVTKTAAEMLLKVYGESEQHGLDIVITRGANTIGPRQFPEKAVPKAIWCFTNNIEFPLFRTPAKRMWMHVEDHAAGIEATLINGISGEIYNLAPSFNSEEITAQVIKKVRGIIGKGKIKEVEDRANYDLRYWMDASKAKNELGWVAKYDLEKTLQSTVTWYLKNINWLKAANEVLISSQKKLEHQL